MPATFTGTQALDGAGTTVTVTRSVTAWTIGCWVYPTDNHTTIAGFMCETDGTASSLGISLIIDNGTIKARWQDATNGTSTSSGFSLTLNTWHKVLAVRSSGSIALYVDDPTTAVDTITLGTASATVAAEYIGFGRAPIGGSQRFRGQIAYAFGASKSLSASERAMFISSRPPIADELEEIVNAGDYFYAMNNHASASGVAGRQHPVFGDHLAGTLIVNSVAPSYADNKAVIPGAHDPKTLDPSVVLDTIPGLREAWTFQEAADGTTNGPFVGRIEGASLVRDPDANNGAASNFLRIGDGIFGPFALRCNDAGLHVPAASTGHSRLLLSSVNKASVIAWVKTFEEWRDTNQMALVAGVWDEADSVDNRSYALFMGLPATPSVKGVNQTPPLNTYPTLTVNGHISNDGGDTPNEVFNYDVSASNESMKAGSGWHCIAMTWDGKSSRAYLDGVLYPRLESPEYGSNPYIPQRAFASIFASDADFRVGGVQVASGGGSWGNFGRMVIGGLAVSEHALSQEQLYALAQGSRAYGSRSRGFRSRTGGLVR